RRRENTSTCREALQDLRVIGNKVAQAITIQNVNLAIERTAFPASNQEVRMGSTSRQINQHDGATCTEVEVSRIQICLVERRKPVTYRNARGSAQFQDAVAIVRTARGEIEAAITRDYVEVVAGVSCRSAAGHPNAGAAIGL